MANTHHSKSKDKNAQLRYALRLTHLLQKERGASVSHYGYSITHPEEIPTLSGIAASLYSGQADRYYDEQSNQKNNLNHSTKASDADSNRHDYRIFFSKAVLRARHNTSVAFAVMDNVEGWVASLKRIRNKIDTAVENMSKCENEEDTVISTHKVVVMYNILISSIIDSLTVQLIQKELQALQRFKSGESDTESSSFSKHGRNPSLVFKKNPNGIDMGTRRASSDSIVPSPGGFSRSLPIYANDESPDMSNANFLTAHQSNDSLNLLSCLQNKSTENGSHANIEGLPLPPPAAPLLLPPQNIQTRIQPPSPSPEPNLFQGPHAEYMVPIKTLPPIVKKPSPSTPSKQFEKSVEDSANEAQDLLMLLLSMVKLKESTGLERAILCSLMSLFTEEDVTAQTAHTNPRTDKSKEVLSKNTIRLSTSKLFNDLVVEEANQRKIAGDLQSRSKNIDLALMKMVEKFLAPGHQMRKVQEMIKDFNLEGLQRSTQLRKFWNIITLYIDQLHALELVIVEELGICLFELDSSSMSIGQSEMEETKVQEDNLQDINQNPKLEDINTDWKSISEEAALQELSRMSADQVKQLFLRHVRGPGVPILPIPEDSMEKAVGLPSPQVPMPTLNDSTHSLKEWEIDLYEIEFRQRIGRGVGGTTYLAKWSGQEVAVKVSANTDLGLEGWYTEVHSLKRLHHPNVIRLLGSVYNPSPQTYGLVLEYCHAGDLSTALQQPTPLNFFWKIADDVANGMSYLHRKKILHRDIKPGNVLLDGDVAGGNFTAKLTDFGVAIMHQGYVGEEHTAETGTYRWMSPEVIRHENYSLMTDVYSYAILVWQLVTHEIPFQPMSQLEAAGKVAIEDARPPLPPDTPELIKALIERCWSKYPDDRLPFSQIAIELKEIHKALSDKEKDWLRHPHGHRVYQHFESGYGKRDSEDSKESRESSRYSNNSRLSKSSAGSRRSTRSRSRDKAQKRKQDKKPGGGFLSLFQKKCY